MKAKDHLIWIDLEMTGLDPNKDRIIEIATVVTDKYLTVLEDGPVFAIHQEAYLLDNMDEWNTIQHNRSCLVERVKNSSVSEAEAEALTIDFLKKYLDPGISPMCGSSICQDRRFLVNYMPDLVDFFHYRHLDVSSFKILAKLWGIKDCKHFEKKSSHLALSDIHDSIGELRFYRDNFLKIDT